MESLFSSESVSSLSAMTIVINILITFALSIAVALVYKHTHQSLSYSQSYIFTIVLLSLVVAVIMMVIGSSVARAFGLLGAFSIIRFRTAIKETKDIAYLFLTMGLGMAVGTGNYLVALLGAATIIVLIFIMHKVDFGSVRKHDFILSYQVDTNIQPQSMFDDIFKKYIKKLTLLNIMSKKDGQESEISYNITFFRETDSRQFIEEISRLEGVSEVRLFAAREDIEY